MEPQIMQKNHKIVICCQGFALNMEIFSLSASFMRKEKYLEPPQ